MTRIKNLFINKNPLGKRFGDRPRDEEMASLLEGLLVEPRRSQVIGHIALDSELTQQWTYFLELVGYDQELHGSDAVQTSEQNLESIAREIREIQERHGITPELGRH